MYLLFTGAREESRECGRLPSLPRCPFQRPRAVRWLCCLCFFISSLGVYLKTHEREHPRRTGASSMCFCPRTHRRSASLFGGLRPSLTGVGSSFFATYLFRCCRARSLRAVILTLSDIVRDWRDGKLLRPKSDVGASDPAATAPAPAPAVGAAAGAAGGVAAAAAAALSGQELDPAGAARALRLLFERVGGAA